MTDHSESDRPGPPLGETSKTSIQISGDDGSVFPATVYTGVSAGDDPELRRELIEGSLNEVESPGDQGRTYRPAVPVTYHDADKKLFVLVIPEALRHEEFDCRRKLLDRMAAQREVVPEYMRRFDVVFDPAELEQLERRRDETEDAGGASDEARQEIRQEFEEQIAERDGEIEELRTELDDVRKQLEDAGDSEASDTADTELRERREELDDREAQLDADRAQLDEVADRVERDSARVAEAREELEEKERELEVRALNLEQRELRAEEQGLGSNQQTEGRGKTQVVTDDQFIEVVDADDADEMETEDAAEAVIADERPAGGRPAPTAPIMVEDGSTVVFEEFSDVADDDDAWFVEPTDDLVAIGFSIDDDRLERFLDGEPAFLFQLHHVDGVPVICLTLAAFDGDGNCLEAVGAPLTDRDDAEQALLDQIARDQRVRLVLFDDDGQRLTAWEGGAPLQANIQWARQTLSEWRESADDVAEADEAAREIGADDFELVGSMRHPFDIDSYTDFEGAADVQLAVNVVGYWSEPEQFDYLIGNRSFPLEAFRQIQKRVVRQAIHWGVVPKQALRQIAVDEAIIVDDEDLVERLISNFAEVCVGLRPNDLDPIDQWENWDRLIDLARSCDVQPDPEVLELAEVSLKRAEEYEEMLEKEEQDLDEQNLDEAGAPTPGSGEIDVTGATVSRRAEESGVTYFLHDADAVDDTFDDLMAVDADQVREALDDSDRRLVAAQVLIEKSGPEVVDEVLALADEMPVVEVAALARFVQARIDGLEAALTQAIDSSGPAGVFIAAYSLAAIESTAAIPRLLEAVRDPERRSREWSLAGCLARFGDKLVPPLRQALTEAPEDEGLLAVLAELEKVRQGAIDEVAKGQGDALRRAGDRARQLV